MYFKRPNQYTEVCIIPANIQFTKAGWIYKVTVYINIKHVSVYEYTHKNGAYILTPTTINAMYFSAEAT